MTDFSSLKPASLNPNVWYHVTEGRVDKVNSTKFTSMLQVTQDGSPAVWGADNINQYWQFQPVDPSAHPGRYALRCTKTKIDKQLSVCYTTDEVTTGHTRPCMASSSGEDAQKWDIADWGDGSYRIVNVKNGTDYVMDVHKGNPPYMSSNLRTDIAQPAQHWIMTSYSNVDEADYSTVFADPTSISTPTASPPADSSSDSSSPSSSSPKGISSGAAAGIGIGVGLGVVALSLFAFFLFRRRQRNSQNVAELGHSDKAPDSFSAPSTSPPTGGVGHDYYIEQTQQQKPENAPPISYELPHIPVPVEADSRPIERS